MTRLAKVWDSLRTSFWFVPGLMTLTAGALAVALLDVDASLDREAAGSTRWLYAGGPDGARSLLSTVAGAIITVIGVVFSITIVSLQLAAQQLGPRLLRTFIRDVGNQVVLGTLVATFTYSVIVLRTVRGEDGAGEERVPHLAVTVGVLLALLSVGCLIYFIHHVAVSLQAEQVVARVAGELRAAIRRSLPERAGDATTSPAPGRPGSSADSTRRVCPSPHRRAATSRSSTSRRSCGPRWRRTSWSGWSGRRAASSSRGSR